MDTLSLWSNVIAFAFMVSSIGLSLVIRARKREVWLDWYLVYAVSYTIWTLIFSIQFFFHLYVETMPALFPVVVAYIRAVLSGAIVLSLSFCIASTIGEGRIARILTITGWIAGLLFFAAGFIARLVPSFIYAASINVAYNTLIGAICIVGLATTRTSDSGSIRRMLPPFLWVSTAFYAVAVSGGLALLFTGESLPIVSSFAISFYCVPWAAVMLSSQSRHLVGGRSDGAIPEAFFSDFKLTPREREVVALLAQGKSNAEIADIQCVSLKTIETHLYHVYRKAGVRNRVELVRAIDSYR